MKVGLLVASFVAAVAAMALVPPIAQDPAYHDFADARTICGVPNFFNVASNAFFLAVAVAGLWTVWKMPKAFRSSMELVCYWSFFLGVGATAFGSAWYHLCPNNERLVVDRGPMTMVIMSLFAAVITERISATGGSWAFPFLLVAGAASVGQWRATGDLRPYALAQYYPVLAIPLILFLYKPRYTGSGHLWATLALYGVAKFFEMSDRTIFNMGRVVSGHTLKHVCAAAALFCIVRMLWRRKIIES